MNISDLNNKIYGFKNLKQGEYANFMMKSVEEQEMLKINLSNYENSNDTNFHKTNKEIKF